MCGICGVYSPTLNEQEVTLFKNLLQINVLRGSDSTGVIKLSKDSNGPINPHFRKALMPSPTYVWSSVGKKFVTKENTYGFIGHTRHATIGAVNAKNTHPFDFDKLIGVHNGTIPGPFTDSSLFTTDSEALYNGINTSGTDFLKEFETQKSAYALVWVDKTNNTLNFIRNDKRPLHFSFGFGGQTLIWSSEKEHLKMMAKRAKMSLLGWTKPPVTTGDVFTLEPGHLMTLKLGENPKNSASITDLGLKKYVPVISYATPYAHAGYTGFWEPEKGSGKGVFKKRADGRYRTDEEERAKQKADSAKDYDGFADTYQDLTELPWLEDKGSIPTHAETLMAAGCYACGDILEEEEVNTVFWQGDAYACDSCYHDSPDDWVRKTHLGVWGEVAVN